MPYPNEHAARLRDPGDFEPRSFRRVNNKFGDGIDVIFGRLKGEKALTVQAIRFNARKFTLEQARKWLKEHDYSPILLERASEEKEFSGILKHLRGRRNQLIRKRVELVNRGDPTWGSKESNGEASPMLFLTTKEGKTRWVTFSSSAFRDRDGEIVSTKALMSDVARADKDGDYGPLRWWHVPGLDIGKCDFNMMHGLILIESGTFASERIAQAVKENADRLEVSIGFIHPTFEPDKDGIYHHIRRFERSLVPKGRVSNRTTRLIL